VPVHEIDGRTLGAGTRGPMVERLQREYVALVRAESRKGPRV
jgi:branched-chain amino acid aminotransferase